VLTGIVEFSGASSCGHSPCSSRNGLSKGLRGEEERKGGCLGGKETRKGQAAALAEDGELLRGQRVFLSGLRGMLPNEVWVSCLPIKSRARQRAEVVFDEKSEIGRRGKALMEGAE